MINIQLVAEGISQGVLVNKFPRNMAWVTHNLFPDLPTVFYDSHILSTISERFTETKIAMLIESEGINPILYSAAPMWIDKYDIVYTHSSRLLEMYPEKCRFKPGGCFTIGSEWSPGNVGIAKKTKLCSLLTSTKTMNPMHSFRLQTANLLKESFVDVTISDIYGSYHSVLDDYMYSICIENYIDKNYFTERILNCFAMGVVPIYLGSPSINEFFDIGGVLQFRSLNELKVILSKISASDYNARRSSIERNYYKTISAYHTLEDWILEEYGTNAFPDSHSAKRV